MPSPGGQALVLRQRREEEPRRDQRRPQQEEGRKRPVGRGQVHLPELREDQRVQRDDAQGHEVQHQQRRVLAQDHLEGGQRQGVQELVRLLPALLGQGAHGQNRDDDDKGQAAKAQHVFEVAHRKLDVVEHGAHADHGQQKRRKDIGRHRVEAAAQLVPKDRHHGFFASSFSSGWALCGPVSSAGGSPALSVSSRKTSSRLARLTTSSHSAFCSCAKAKNRRREAA